jgi:hypothetical protein
LSIVILKPGFSNINLVNCHIAQVGNELAKEVNKEQIKVYTLDDGKLWLVIDNSFNLHELETLHPKTALPDMRDIVAPYFNDMRQNPHYLPSSTKAYIDGLKENQDIILNTQKEYAYAIKEHLNAIRTISKVMGGLRHKIVKDVLNALNEGKTPKQIDNLNQTSLERW